MPNVIGPDTFMSGEQSYRYSAVAEPELVATTTAAIEELLCTVKRQEDELNTLRGEIESQSHHIETLEGELNSWYIKISELQHIVHDVHNIRLEQLNDMVRVSWLFFNSPLFRFLNFFGCWFIYPDDKIWFGNAIYPNESKYEDYGAAPLLTRLKRKFLAWKERHFPNKQ